MDTGADNYDEMRWVLRAIKRERSLTPAGENVKIDIDQLTNRYTDAPATDTIRKCIKLLVSQGAFRVEKKYIDVPFDPYDPVDATWERAKNFELAIKQDLFDAVCGGYENPVGPIDLKSDDAVYFKEEKAKISAINHPEDHKLELTRWLEVKGILDEIHRQLSPMGKHNQMANLNLKRIHKNISDSVLDDLWRRGICGYGGGAQSPDWERFYYMKGSLIEVRDLNRFNNYRNGVSDFVKWIEQDTARFSKIGDDHKEPASQNGASDIPLASQRKLKLLEILKEEWELTPKTGIKIGKAANLIDHPAGVCKIHFDTFTEKWIPRALLDSPEQLENLLTLFMTEGLIRWRRLDNNETIIEIKFPEDFESRYESYTSQILGSKGNAKAAELGNKTEVGGEKVSAQSTNNSVSSVASKPTMNLAKSAPSAPKKESTVGNPPFATKPEFDDKKSRIIWNGQYCEIPINKNSYFFCKKMFESTFGEKVSELDISEQDSWDNDSTRSVYFAMQWVNKLLKDGYGIGEDLFKARTNHYSIRDELFKLS